LAPQREWFEKDYYKVLGVPESATQKEITRAYRQMARELHPDANPDDPRAEERFKEVSAAYDVVGDDAKRKEYDEVRKLGPMAGGFGFGGPGGPGGGSAGQTFNFDGGDIGDLLGNLFGRRRGGAGAGPGFRGTGPQRGTDLEAEVHLPFREAVRGFTTTLHLTSDAPCSTCHGSGARPGSTPEGCPQCGGRGVLDDNQGLFSFSTPCPNCAGRGSIITDPCPTCRGSGVERRPREVKVRIPSGVDDGQRIRLKGRGGPGRNGGPAGDLFVTVHVERDPVFGREGRNLTVTVPLTFSEAALGTKVKVPTLDGGTVTLKVPEGTPSGKVFRVRNRGVDTGKGTGDLLVTVQVAVPRTLTPDQREAIEAFAAATTESPREFLGVSDA
jgi:molecular chaperone DnaJ